LEENMKKLLIQLLIRGIVYCEKKQKELSGTPYYENGKLKFRNIPKNTIVKF